MRRSRRIQVLGFLIEQGLKDTEQRVTGETWAHHVGPSFSLEK